MSRLPARFRAVPFFAQPYVGYTDALARYVCSLQSCLSLKAVAERTHLSWDTVKDIVKSDLARRFAHIPLRQVKYIAVDEIYLGKKKKYFTLIIDLESGRILWLAKGKGQAALLPGLRKLRLARAKVRAAACDMSNAYFEALRVGLPHTALVFDRFHIIKLCNEKIDQIRRTLQGEADELGLRSLKGLRYLLLMGRENLPDPRPAALEEALQFNQPLSVAYYLKEELRALWQQPSRTAMTEYFHAWVQRALDCGLAPLVTLATTLQRYATGILNWAFFPISSGKMEGTNLKIKNLLRVAYGYRDERFFELRLLSLHETKQVLTGT